MHFRCRLQEFTDALFKLMIIMGRAWGIGQTPPNGTDDERGRAKFFPVEKQFLQACHGFPPRFFISAPDTASPSCVNLSCRKARNGEPRLFHQGLDQLQGIARRRIECELNALDLQLSGLFETDLCRSL